MSERKQIVQRRHTSEQIVQRRHSSEQIVQRRHTSEHIVQRRHPSEQIVQRRHTSEHVVQRRHTSEQIVQRSCRSGEDHVNRDKIKVTHRRTEKQSEMEVVGTPSQVGRFFQGVVGGHRIATSSSRGERLPQVPHRSQVVEDFSSTRAVRGFPGYGHRQTSSSTNYSTAPQATYPSRPKVETKDGATKTARRK